MNSKEFWEIYDEAKHRHFQWVIEHKDSWGDIKEEAFYWIAVVAQERKK